MSKTGLAVGALAIACLLGGCDRREAPPAVAAPAASPSPPAGASAAPTQLVFLLSYRSGPYGKSGSSLFAGWIDYMALLNARGGINGVRLQWEECETEYNTVRGLECYQQFKARWPGRASIIQPLSTGISHLLLEPTAADRMPLVTIGYGPADATDGRHFPYAFPLVASFRSQASAMLRFIESRLWQDGGRRLAGRKIGFVFHDSAFGREPLPLLRAVAAKRRFQLLELPVPHPGLDQGAQWESVRREQPDFVIFWGWGEMNSAGLLAAQRSGFPRERMIGVWWAGAEEDTLPAGDAARGYIAASFGRTGRELPIVREVLDTLYAGGQGNLKDASRVGSVLYARGLLHGIVTAEAIRTAQARYGSRELDGEQLRWGLENLRIDQRRLAELGAAGIMPDLAVTCQDHEGSGKVMFQQWDGRAWQRVSDYLEGDRVLAGQLLDASVRKLAREKSLTPRDCPADAATPRQPG